MCVFSRAKIPAPRPIQMPSTDGREAMQQSTMTARLMARRRGAAANVLTSPTGVSKMGEVA
jgi:hypothetical protein